MYVFITLFFILQVLITNTHLWGLCCVLKGCAVFKITALWYNFLIVRLNNTSCYKSLC